MAQRRKQEGSGLNNITKIMVGIVVLAVFFLGAVIIQAFFLKPATTIALAKIPAGEYDPAVWGEHYPLEYRSYLKNREMSPSPTGFGGSEKVQKSLKEPEILMNFKGMPFSTDYSEDRGHPYSVQDLKESKRVTPASVGACMTCKTAHMTDIYSKKGWAYASLPLAELFIEVKHPITCANCHDPATMKLRVFNPAFVEAMKKKGIDTSRAPREDMRSYVCGQCHSEYYFEPKGKKVVFPWDDGFLPEQMYAYYEGKPANFEQDWIHPDSQARMLKAQHPDFETFSGGVHAKSGVSCADCHMPFMVDRGQKYSSHWMTSPLKHVKESCGTCHNQGEAWLLERVRTEQNNVWQLQHTAGQALARAHEVVAKASAVGAADKAGMDKARGLLRKSQWFWDTVAAENSMGFHNPDQVLNTLGRSIDMAHQAAVEANKAAKTRF